MSHSVRERHYFSQFGNDIASVWNTQHLPDTGRSTCSWIAPPSSHSPTFPFLFPLFHVMCLQDRGSNILLSMWHSLR